MAENVATSVAALSIPIEVVGCDLDGMQFIEPAKTLVITRDGATSTLENKLAPESELIVRNLRTGEEALARVVGRFRDEVHGNVYGFAILHRSESLWDVQFPPESTKKNVFLECSVCRDVFAASLLEIETVVLQANKEIARICENCGAVTIWKLTDREISSGRPSVSPIPVEKPKEDPEAGKEKRTNKRAEIKVTACVRYSGIDTVVACENMSRGGFRFRSRKKYPVDLRFEASVPYTKSSFNIFAHARIMYCQELANGEYRHGVAYIKTLDPKDWMR